MCLFIKLIIIILQPSYPVVMPIWISDNEDKYIADLVGELNMSEAAGSSHPVSMCVVTEHKMRVKSLSSRPYSFCRKFDTLSHRCVNI